MQQAKDGPKRRRPTKDKAQKGNKSTTGATQFRGPVAKERADGTSHIIYTNQDFEEKLAKSMAALAGHSTGLDSPQIVDSSTTEHLPEYGSFYYSSSEHDSFQQQFVDGLIPDTIDTAPIPEVPVSMVQSKSQLDYINEFVSRLEDILPATIATEYLDEDQRQCNGCPSQNSHVGIWRCRDCFNPGVYCRGCMRKQHISNPFHHIECWMGDHFRPAALWEVGVFIAVPHHLEATRRTCSTLNSMVTYTESLETSVDSEEAIQLQRKCFPPVPAEMDHSGFGPAGGDPAEETPDGPDDDDLFEQQLQDAYKRYGEKGRGDDPPPPSIPLTDPDVRQSAHKRDLKRVVHTNGIHYIHILTCPCGGNPGLIGDLVACSLMPASFTIPKTFFTKQLLDFSRLCNLELKCSLYQFHELLQRLTLPLAPSMVKSLYHEFRRMCRLWRWLKKLKWAGFIGDADPREPGSRKFTNFCAACPQPGINLPAEWVDDADNPIYGRTFVADGNFKADHLEQSGEDIPLYDGAGIMPNSAAYHKHLSSKAPCDNTFRAIEAALSASKSCDITGVVGIACARHGCYCPNGMVDLQRGEQQKNVDYAFVKSIQHTNVDIRQKVTLLYDIACQYFVHLRGRIDPLLAAGESDLRNLVIDRAIGLFHVHAHKDQCFFRFSPTFIPGLGTVAGEILESLWSALNEISISLRTSSISYRAEMLDDHATDSNHKKMMNMAASLANFLQVAAETSAEHTEIFEEINARAKDLGLAEGWETAVSAAEKDRMTKPELMDLYGVDLSKVEVAPTMQNPAGASSTIQQYFDHTLQIEERQIELRLLVKKAGTTPTEAELKVIISRRESLRGLCGSLPRISVDAGINLSLTAEKEVAPGMEDPSIPDEHVLCLPSNRNMVQKYDSTELSARVAQATAQLNHIRELIVEKSLQYSHIIRVVKSKGVTTRARQKVNDISHRLDLHSRIYAACRDKMVILRAEPQVLDYFKVLDRNDLNSSTALLLPNARKSTEMSLTLSWIWRSRMAARAGAHPAGKEDNDPVAVQEFLRVHWLRARALSQRWAEELTLLSHEMQWTVRFYLYKAKEWKNAALKVSPAGGLALSAPAGAYARRKRDAWLKLAVQADIVFRETNYDYKSPMSNHL